MSMKRASQFSLAPSWKLLLCDMQIDPTEALVHAGLPEDLFSHPQIKLSPLEYFRFWEGVEKAANGREFPLLLAQCLSVEVFDPPLFAAICSQNLNAALRRIQQYKPLIGPMNMQLDINTDTTSLSISCYGHQGILPRIVELGEVVFFTQMTRLATRKPIEPLKVIVTQLPKDIVAYEAYFGCRLEKGETTTLIFNHTDATQPFLTANAAMWNYFEEGLNKNLANIETNASTAQRVTSVLIELLPTGVSSIEAVADKLAMSKRSLQRRLAGESLNYHTLVQTTRIDLASYYLTQSELSLGEIGFLLGYQETNSFIRAFKTWKGISPGQYREQ